MLTAMLEVLRAGSWVNRFRVNAYSGAVLAIGVALSIRFLAQDALGDQKARWSIGPDFTPNWAAARIAVSGTGASPYDRDALLGFEREIFSDIAGRIFPFPYPPLVFLLLLAILHRHAGLIANLALPHG